MASRSLLHFKSEARSWTSSLVCYYPVVEKSVWFLLIWERWFFSCGFTCIIFKTQKLGMALLERALLLKRAQMLECSFDFTQQEPEGQCPSWRRLARIKHGGSWPTVITWYSSRGSVSSSIQTKGSICSLWSFLESTKKEKPLGMKSD